MAGMDAVPSEIVRAAYRRKPIQLLRIPLHFGLWGACVAVIGATRDHPAAIPIGIACSILIAQLIRGLGAIAHDAVHGNCARSKLLSYLIALLCWSPTGMSVTIYANYHLHHHKIANTYADVDNFVVTDYTRHPFLAKLLLFAVYTFAYPIYFMFSMFRYVKRLPWPLRVRMHLELAAIFGLVALAIVKLPMHVFFFSYGLPFLLGAVLASVTSMIEHFEMPATDDDAYSSRTYGTKAPILRFLWNNVGFHNEHHKYPGIPFYNLRTFHEAAYPFYDDRVKAEVYPDTLGIALRLYRRILDLDIRQVEARHAGIDKEQELRRVMAMEGIQPGAPA